MTNTLTTMKSVPGLLVGTTLRAARLPLSAVARVTGQGEEWPPAMAFESAEAAVETTVGSLLRDDALVSRGRLRQARLAKLREASQLDAVARRKRRGAEDELESRRDDLATRREQVEETAEQRERRIEQQADKRQAKVAKAATARKTATRRKAAAAEQAIDEQERSAKLAAAEAEAVAVDLERAAIAAEDVAIEADAAIDVSKDARASG